MKDLKRLGLYTKLAVLYAVSIATLWAALQPASAHGYAKGENLTKSSQKPYVPLKPIVISGMPDRLTIPGSSWNGVAVDLKVIPGYYDSSSDSWTLSGYNAQFAMMSTMPNNVSGQSFIYGHNNDNVFGALRHVTPSPGASAFLYTTNGHIFEYAFVKADSVGPNDSSILAYNGPSELLIQTCTGSLNEWRTEYTFAFEKVVQ